MTVAITPVRAANWSERGATIAVFMALGLAVGTWAAAIPALRDALGLDPARLSGMLLALPVASLMGTIIMGVVAPRIGNGRATVGAAAAVVVAFALPALATSYPLLLACGVAMGLAAGGLEVAVNGHASDIEQRWGAAIMSSFHAAFSIGGLLGASAGGLATWAGAGLQGQLWWPLGLAGLLVAVAASFLGAGARAEAGHGPTFRWPERPLLVLSLVALLSYLLEGAMADWSAVYLTTTAAAAPWFAAAGYGAASATMAVGRLTGDVVVGRLGARRVLVAGAVLAALGMTLAVAVPSPWPVAAGFALVGAGVANIVPVVFSAAGREATSPAAGIATVSSFGFAGFLGGPPIIGAVATWTSLRVAMGLLVVAALAMALAASTIGSQPSRRRSRT